MNARRPVLTPGKAALLMVGLATVALMGVPGIGPAPGPRGALQGVLVDERGFGIADGTLALFDAEDHSVAEITHSDGHGRFAFQVVPRRYHVLAHPGDASELVPAWELDRRAGSGGLEFVLRRGRPLTVHVVDAEGQPLRGAEIRVYDTSDEPAVLQRGLTDDQGEWSTRVPETVHLAALAPPERVGLRTRLNVEVPEAGLRATLRFPHSALLGGVVSDPRGPLAGVVISAWSGEGALWEGFAVTDAQGRFELSAPVDETLELHVVDPENLHEPLERRVVTSGAELSLLMTEVRRVEVRTETSRGEPLPTRLWTWSPVQEQWTWGVPTDPRGRTRTLVAPGGAAYAVPLHGAHGPLEAWDLEPEAGEVVVRAAREKERM